MPIPPAKPPPPAHRTTTPDPEGEIICGGPLVRRNIGQVLGVR